jgi:pimeloyl-[acyl-carrier protein] synthase
VALQSEVGDGLSGQGGATLSPSILLAGLVGDPRFGLDPYPAYKEFLNFPGWVTPSGYQVFSRYDDVARIMRDHEAFGQEGIPYPNFHVLDPPDHTRLRRLVATAFTQRAANRQHDQIAGFVDELLAGVEARGSMNLMDEFALPLPARVGASMLGVPFEDVWQWNEWLWSIGLFRGRTSYLTHGSEADKTAAKDAAAAAADYFRHLIAERRSVGGSDIVSALLAAREGADQLSEDEVLYSLVLILGGSLHTTASQIGNIFRALFEHPEAMSALAADPLLVAGVVNEGMRYDGSLQAEYRVARIDATVGEVEVCAGAPIIVAVGAANRDPAQFPDPDVFDIRRANASQHLTFGTGIHRCLGAQLAQTEMLVAVRMLVQRLPGLRLAGAPVQHQYDRWRGLRSLPVAWDVA